MKHFRFAPLGMVVLLCLFSSCSPGGTESGGAAAVGKTADEVPAGGETEEAAKAPAVGETSDEAAADGEAEETADGETEEDPDDEPDPSAPDVPEGEGGTGVPTAAPAAPPPADPPLVFRAPALLINELRTEFSRPKAEFIELKMLSDGNLGALRVFAAGNKKNPLIYQFQPLEVKAGEYVVLHLRTLSDLCMDEYGDDWSESGGVDSCPTARDFWIPGDKERLRKTDIVYVLDQNGRVLDAVMIAEDTSLPWKNDSLAAAAAEFVFKQGAWKTASGETPTPADAADSSGIRTSITRSVSRDETMEDTHSAADWYVTANNGATPGEPNNPKRLQQ